MTRWQYHLDSDFKPINSWIVKITNYVMITNLHVTIELLAVFREVSVELDSVRPVFRSGGQRLAGASSL